MSDDDQTTDYMTNNDDAQEPQGQSTTVPPVNEGAPTQGQHDSQATRASSHPRFQRLIIPTMEKAPTCGWMRIP
eukprot:2871621-Heterocapsa_arctica.AAC.1